MCPLNWLPMSSPKSFVAFLISWSTSIVSVGYSDWSAKRASSGTLVDFSLPDRLVVARPRSNHAWFWWRRRRTDSLAVGLREWGPCARSELRSKRSGKRQNSNPNPSHHFSFTPAGSMPSALHTPLIISLVRRTTSSPSTTIGFRPWDWKRSNSIRA